MKNPPSRGPATLAAPNTAPKKPWYRPRSRGLTTSAMIAMASTMRPPAPTPWTARKAMSVPIEVAMPDSTLPARKMTMAAWNRRLRP